MTDLKLDIEIINSEKRDVSAKRKTTLFSILSGLWLLLLYSQPAEDNSIYDRLGIWKGYPAILLVVLLVLSAYVIMYVFFIVPSKGKISLNKDGLIITLNNIEKIISLSEIEIVKFYIYQEGEETKVHTELTSDKINLSNEINIAFASERKILWKLVDLWKDKGVNAEIVATAP